MRRQVKPLHTVAIALIALVLAFSFSSFIPHVTVLTQWLIFGTAFLVGILIWREISKPRG